MRTSQLHKRDTQTPTRYIPNLNIEPWMRARDRRWVSRYNQLTFIVNRIHRFPTHSEMPSNLSSWVRNQRRSTVQLPNWRRDRLREISSFSFDPRGDRWEATHRSYWKWQLDHQRLPKRRSGNRNESNLARWGERQRRNSTTKQLPYGRSVLLIGAIACSRRLSHLPHGFAATFFATHHIQFEERGIRAAAFIDTAGIVRKWSLEPHLLNPSRFRSYQG